MPRIRPRLRDTVLSSLSFCSCLHTSCPNKLRAFSLGRYSIPIPGKHRRLPNILSTSNLHRQSLKANRPARMIGSTITERVHVELETRRVQSLGLQLFLQQLG